LRKAEPIFTHTYKHYCHKEGQQSNLPPSTSYPSCDGDSLDLYHLRRLTTKCCVLIHTLFFSSGCSSHISSQTRKKKKKMQLSNAILLALCSFAAAAPLPTSSMGVSEHTMSESSSTGAISSSDQFNRSPRRSPGENEPHNTLSAVTSRRPGRNG